jgi:hypothetical protein
MTFYCFQEVTNTSAHPQNRPPPDCTLQPIIRKAVEKSTELFLTAIGEGKFVPETRVKVGRVAKVWITICTCEHLPSTKIY